MGLVVVAAFALLVITALLVERGYAEHRWSGERHALLNRIQHPAIFQHYPGTPVQESSSAPPEDEYEMAGRILAGAPEEEQF